MMESQLSYRSGGLLVVYQSAESYDDVSAKRSVFNVRNV
jgi:hypothetical protein